MTGYRRYLAIAVLAAIVAAAHFSGWLGTLDPQAILARRQTVQDWSANHPVLAPLVFMGVYITVVTLALPAAAILSLLGGFLFGRWPGFALVLVSASTGAILVFKVARSAIGGALRRRAGPLYEKVAANMRENAFGYLLFLRVVPLFPFFLVNLVAALFEIKTATFLLATVLGMAPATFVYVNVGQELGNVSNFNDLISPNILLALTGLGLLALGPVVYRQWRHVPKRSP